MWGKRAGTCVSRTYGGLYLLSFCLAALTNQAGAACGTLCPLGSLGTGGVAEQRGCSQRAIQVRNRAIAMRRHAHRLIRMHSHSSQPPTLLWNSTAAGANYRQTNSAFSGSSLKTVNPPYHQHYHPDQPLGVV